MKRSALLSIFAYLALAALTSCGGGGGGEGVPTAPTNVAIVAGDGQATVSWDAVAGADSYHLYWKTSPGVATTDSMVDAATSPQVLSGLANGMAYYCVVAAVNASGEGPLSVEVSAIPQKSAPAAPTGVAASAGNSLVTISWNYVDGASSYNIYWSTISGVTKATGTKLAGVASPYPHPGLTNGVTYYYVVTAVNGGGESQESAEVSATPQAVMPTAPVGVVATAGDKTVTVTWSAIAGAPFYNIYWSTISGVTKATGAKLSSVSSPYTHAGLTNGTTYYYVVTAVNGDGESLESAQVSATPSLPPLGTPLNLSATPGVQSVALQWSPVADATSYNIYWRKFPGVTTSNGTLLAQATSPYKHAGLTAGIYYYIVTAVGQVGEGAASSEVSAPANLVMFVTSATGSGTLRTWADAGGKTGLAAADTICQARAAAAGLTGVFRAWISNSANDAYCWVHNLSGKKSANCGQVTLPVGAGPWIRTDGFPFAGTIDQVVNNYAIYSPARFDEFGKEVTMSLYFTGTEDNGVLDTLDSPPACDDWQVGGMLSVAAGWTVFTGSSWTARGCACWETGRLLCLQTGTGPSLPNFTASGKKVFQTSTTHNGNFGGLAGADAICQARAGEAGLTGTFKAWLSTDTINAADRLTSSGPWVRLDGMKIAESKADLLDGLLFTAINVTEQGVYDKGGTVWTGTNANGSLAVGLNCSGWTDGTNASLGIAGGSFATDAWWTKEWSNVPCYGNEKLYCFED